jgi:hypothetical protein
MYPLSANANVLSADFPHLPACWYHANVTLGGRNVTLGGKQKAESTLALAESGYIVLAGPQKL